MGGNDFNRFYESHKEMSTERFFLSFFLCQNVFIFFLCFGLKEMAVSGGNGLMSSPRNAALNWINFRGLYIYRTWSYPHVSTVTGISKGKPFASQGQRRTIAKSQLKRSFNGNRPQHFALGDKYECIHIHIYSWPSVGQEWVSQFGWVLSPKLVWQLHQILLLVDVKITQAGKNPNARQTNWIVLLFFTIYRFWLAPVPKNSGSTRGKVDSGHVRFCYPSYHLRHIRLIQDTGYSHLRSGSMGGVQQIAAGFKGNLFTSDAKANANGKCQKLPF